MLLLKSVKSSKSGSTKKSKSHSSSSTTTDVDTASSLPIDEAVLCQESEEKVQVDPFVVEQPSGSSGDASDSSVSISNIVDIKDSCSVILKPTNLRYRTSIIDASPKKLFACARQLKGMSISKAIDTCYLSSKKAALYIGKSLLSIKSNIINVRNISDDISNVIIKKVIIEKRYKFYGYRYKAKGGVSRSVKVVCSLNIYFKKLS